METVSEKHGEKLRKQGEKQGRKHRETRTGKGRQSEEQSGRRDKRALRPFRTSTTLLPLLLVSVTVTIMTTTTKTTATGALLILPPLGPFPEVRHCIALAKKVLEPAPQVVWSAASRTPLMHHLTSTQIVCELRRSSARWCMLHLTPSWSTLLQHPFVAQLQCPSWTLSTTATSSPETTEV